MIKVKYPEKISDFKSEYLKIFDVATLDTEWQQYKSTYNLQNANFSVTDMLYGDFNFLLDKSFNMAYSISDIKVVQLKKIFDYDKYQPKIADFFMKYKDEMKLSSCYYCNIDFINAFSTRNRNNKLSFKNHFTLDHVIDKATNPIVALSLFNFVPSCYSCNSKFKRSEQFTKVVADKYKSPTYADFNFNEDVKLKVFYTNGKNSLNINSIDDFEINFDDSKHLFEDYIKIFKLKERYRFHKNIALELLTKKKNYSDSRVDEISRIIGISKEEIKKDLFGKEVFEGELQEKPFTKLKRDIYV
ncbi:MAG TPA: hypothetical protein CFH79_03100 [Sulfurospirillum sp. UBA11407]|nr:MAG TPA: hypothetical protein CFH79_03100 [Sulfurospirillum sp. UBA11407]